MAPQNEQNAQILNSILGLNQQGGVQSQQMAPQQDALQQLIQSSQGIPQELGFQEQGAPQQVVQQQMAQQQSLLSESDPWSLDEFGKQFSNSTSMNKREDTYNKISEREMMGQMGRNPFMSENNYLHDVITQDDFLKPISTTGEREKHHNYE